MTNRRLDGQTVLVAASEERAIAIANSLRAAGIEAVPVPTVQIEPTENLRELDRALSGWDSYDWVVFTSTNGVHAAATRARALGLELRTQPPRVAAVGPATKAAAEAEGLAIDAMPDEFLTDAIADVLGTLGGRRVLLLRSNLGRKSLSHRLRSKGAIVDEVDSYATRRSSADISLLPSAFDVDLVAFTSGSAVRNLVAVLASEYVDALRTSAAAVCIGPVTAEAARECGFRIASVAREHTGSGLTKAVQEALTNG